MSEQMELDRLNAARLEKCGTSPARERLSRLFDENTFVELDAFTKSTGSGVITGYGEVDGATVFAFSQDVSAAGGAIGRAQADKIGRLYDLAVKTGAPVIGIYDSKGGAVGEGNELLRAYSDLLEKANNLSGVVPQISLVLGVCGGAAAMTAMAADFVIMSKDAELFLVPPSVAKGGEKLGTAETAMSIGAAHIVADDENAAIDSARRLIGVLPENNLSGAVVFDYAAPADNSVLNGILDQIDDVCVCDITKAIADDQSVLPLSTGFGKGVCTALCTVGGYTVGMVGTKGELDHNAAARISRFVSVCDSFQIPVVTLINTQGVAPSGEDELAGAVRDMARLAHVYAEATTPKIAVITGQAIGSAYVALANADVTLGWPGAVVSAMPVSSAVAFLKGAEITNEHPREAVEQDYAAGEASIYAAAENGLVQAVVTPEETRQAIIRALEMLSSKRVSHLPKKHSNLPM